MDGLQDIFDLLRDLGPLVTLGGGVADFFQQRDMGDQLQAFANSGATDPFGQNNRQLYQARLNEVYNNPNVLESLPGLSFARSQGEKAINRGAAARGDFYSGNVLHELSKFNQDLATSFYSDEMSRLMQLSGANARPDAGNAYRALAEGLQADNNALGSLLAGATLAGAEGGEGGVLGSLGNILGNVPPGTTSLLGNLGNLFGGAGSAAGTAGSAALSTGAIGSGAGILGGGGSLGSIGAAVGALPASLFSGIAGSGTAALSTGAIGTAASNAGILGLGGGVFPGIGGAGAGAAGAGAAAGAGGAASGGLGGVLAGLSPGLLAGAFAAPLLMGIFNSINKPDLWTPFYNSLGDPVTIPNGAPGAGQQGIPLQVDGKTVYLHPSIKDNKGIMNLDGTAQEANIVDGVNLSGIGNPEDVYNVGAVGGDWARIVGTDQVVGPNQTTGAPETRNVWDTNLRAQLSQNREDATRLGVNTISGLNYARREEDAR